MKLQCVTRRFDCSWNRFYRRSRDVSGTGYLA